MDLKVCVQCTQSRPLAHFRRRSGGKRRGTCRACRLAIVETDAHASSDAQQHTESLQDEVDVLSVMTDVAASPEQGDTAEAPAPKRKRRRRKRRGQAHAVPPPESLVARPGYAPRPPPYMTMRAADASALKPTRGGFIRMRGKSDNGRRWYQEIELELAMVLVRERAAVIVKPHTIQRLYANKEFRRMILEREDYRCYYCGQYGDTIDHLLPRAKGGHTTPLNCVCACNACNQSKADQDLEVFVQRFD